MVRLYESRPSRFAEQFADPASAEPGLEAEKAEIGETFDAYAESFKASGQTRDGLLAAFEARRKENPKLTAKAFLKPSTR